MINVNNSSNVVSNKSLGLSHKRIFSTDKRCYTMSHRMQFLNIKSGPGYRYMTAVSSRCIFSTLTLINLPRYFSTTPHRFTPQDHNRLNKADLMFDRSDAFLNKLNAKDEFLPISIGNILQTRPVKHRTMIRKSIFGLNN